MNEGIQTCAVLVILFVHQICPEGTTIGYKGKTVTIQCLIPGAYIKPLWLGPGEITYYDPGIGFNPNLEDISPRLSLGVDNRSLMIADAKPSDAGIYKCTKVLNGESLDASNTLKMRTQAMSPAITTTVQVVNNMIRAIEAKPVAVTCTSNGGNPVPTVAWYRGSSTGIPLIQKNTGTQNGDGTFIVSLTYTFTPTRQDDGQQYICRSFWPTPLDAQGSLENNISLYLYHAVTVQIPTRDPGSGRPSVHVGFLRVLRCPLPNFKMIIYANIVTIGIKPFQPSVSQTTDTVADNYVTVMCITSGGRPAASISWEYLEQPYTSNVIVINDTQNQTFTTESVLRRQVTATDNGQTIVCRVSHMALDKDLTASALLNVHFPVGRISTKLTGNRLIVANGVNQLPLVCTTGSSNPPADIIWKNGTVVIPNNNVYTNNKGANNGIVRSQTLQLTPTRYDHGNNISCSATNGVNQFTDTTIVTLNLNYNPIVSISENTSLTLTEESNQLPQVLPCSADSNPTATIKWYHNGRAVTPGSLSGSLSYTITDANRTSYGNYTCTADNNVPPGDKKTYMVEVLFRPLGISIDKPNKNVIANGMNSMSITCTPGISNPVSEITWTIGKIQTGQPDHSDRPGDYGGIIRTSRILIHPSRDDDGATVTCAAKNNVTGPIEISNTTIIDNIVYSPLIADIPDKDVVEGDSVTLPCHASSKPLATFTWRHDVVVMTNGHGTTSYNGLNYTIHNISRTQAGLYTCTANNQVPSNDSKQAVLRVLYPPSIKVFAINTTVNSRETSVTCNASGVPDNYSYEKWVHKWNGHVVNHSVPLAATRVLILTSLSYADSGSYTCGASNGIKGVHHGAGDLLVKSPPILVGDVANTLEIKASGQLMKTTTVTFQYYSNAGRGNVTFQKTNSSGESVGEVHLRDVNIILPVFLSEIETIGTDATIDITVNNMSQFGSYDVFVTNGIMDSVGISVIIQPLGPPEPPELINSTVLDHQSVTIIWISGFPNGLNQTFVIQLSTDKSNWRNITQYGGMSYQQTHSRTIDSLAGSQLYYMRMLAFNKEGESEPTSIFSFKTLVSPKSSPIRLIAGGAAGGVIAAAVVIVVIIVILRRQKAARTSGSAKDKRGLVMSSIHNEGYDNGDEEVINRLYESASVTETVVGASTSKQVPPGDVDNIYAKVNKKPEVVYAMPEKKKEKQTKRPHNPIAMKTQKDWKKKKEKHDKIKKQTGDVYENSPSIMPGKKSTPLSEESVYEDTSVSAPASPKKSTGTDGLLYADLEFAPRKKGQTKIIGIEERCEYTTIDLTKKAQPLPDSDDEDKTNI